MRGEISNISFPDAVWGCENKSYLAAGYRSGETSAAYHILQLSRCRKISMHVLFVLR
jgi:hypothetical protein